MALLFTPGHLRRRAELYHRLGQLTAAGIGLLPALEKECQRPASRSLLPFLTRVLHHLREGNTLGEALRAVPDWMPPFDAALLQAGELSGRLPRMFQQLARHYENRAGLARQFLAYLAYPALLLHVGVLIFPIAALQQLVLHGQSWAYAGQKLMVLGPLYALAVLGVIALQGHRGETWRALMETVLGCVPWLGAARRHLALARLASALESLISAGISIIEAWELAASASGSPALRHTVRRAKPDLYAGLTPAEMLDRSAAFPGQFSRLYATGEVSGQLEDSLERLTAYHQEEGFRKLKQFLAGVSGLVMGLVLLLAAWQILAFWLNYFRQIQEVIPQ